MRLTLDCNQRLAPRGCTSECGPCSATGSSRAPHPRRQKPQGPTQRHRGVNRLAPARSHRRGAYASQRRPQRRGRLCATSDALSRKLKGASREWPWQWLFPATRIYTDRLTAERRRHHIHWQVFQDGAQTIFEFDLGACLVTAPSGGDDNDEQWYLYEPGNIVLSLRADARYTVEVEGNRGGAEPTWESLW